MAVDKKLTIGVEAKVGASVNQLSKMLDDLAARGNKFARAVQGVAGVQGEGAVATKQGGLAKALLAEKKLFEDLGKSGEKLSKILTEQVGKSQVTLRRQIEDSNTTLKKLTTEYERASARVEALKRGGAPDWRVQLASGYAARAQRGVQTAAGAKLGAEQALGMLGDEAPERRGLMGRFMESGAVQGIANLTGMGGMMSLIRYGGPVAIGAALGMGIWRSVQRFTEAPFMVQAQVGSGVGEHLGAVRGFDPGYLLGRAHIMEDPGKLNRARWGALISTGFSVVKGALDIPSWIAGERPEMAEGDVAFAGTAARFMRAEAQKDPDKLQRLSTLMENSQAKLAHVRRYGAGAWQAAIAAGTGADPMAMEITRSMQATAAAGVGARSVAAYTPLMVAMARSGMAPGAIGSIVGGTAALGGLPGLGMAGDPVIREMMGQAAAGWMGPGAMTAAGGAGLMAMLTPDSGGAAGIRETQQRIMGVQARGQLMSGFDPYQRSFNLATAVSLMPGASPYAQNLLSSALSDPNTLAAVMSGQLPRGFASMGITMETAQSQAQQVGASLLNRWVDVGPGATKSEQLMRRVRDEYGGDFGKFMQSVPRKLRAGAAEDLAPMLAGVTGWEWGQAMGFLETAAGAAPGAFAARGARRPGAGARPQRPEDPAMEHAREQIRTTTDMFDGLTTAGKNATTELKGITKQMKEVREGDVKSALGIRMGPKTRTE